MRNYTRAPRARSMSPEHAEITLMRPENGPGALSMRKFEPELIFATFKWKSPVFCATSGGNIPYKYQAFHSPFLIQNKTVEEEGGH